MVIKPNEPKTKIINVCDKNGLVIETSLLCCHEKKMRPQNHEITGSELVKYLNTYLQQDEK